MLKLPTEHIYSWLDVQAMLLNTSNERVSLRERLKQAKEGRADLNSQLDIYDCAELLDRLDKMIAAAEHRLTVLERATIFSGENNPKYCRCKHQRRYTGVFFNSVELIHCLSCHGWQSVRSVIL